MTETPRYDADDVRNAALARLPSVAETVLGTIRRRGKHEWRWSGKGSSFGTVTMNATTGQWHRKRTGDGGDVLSLWAMHMGLPDTKGANFGAVLSNLGDFLGVAPVSGTVDPAERSRQRAAIDRARQEREAAAQVEAAKVETIRAGNLAAMQGAAVPVAGTIAETYLRSRGIVSPVPDTFAGFIPAGALGSYRKGLVQSDAAALVVWARDPGGQVIGAQRVLLTDEGHKRLVETDDGPAAKFTTARGDGARVALPQLVEDATGGALVIGEGPETALALWQEAGAEAWCVFGSSGWAGLVDLLPRDRRVILCPDADALGSPAWRAFQSALRDMTGAGVRVEVCETPARYGVKADAGDVLETDGGDAVRAMLRDTAPATPEYLAKRDNLARLKGSPIGGEAPRVGVDFLPVAEATARVWGAVEAAFADARVWHHRHDGQASKPAPVHVLKATAGLGKSRTVRDVIGAELARGVPDDHAIYVAVPTLDLADEARRAFDLDYPLWPSMVFRGRSANDPGGASINLDEPAKMCIRHDLASEVSASGLSVRPHLCEAKSGAAWCRSGCRYLGQSEQGARVVFLSHEYLRHGVPEGMPPAWAVIVDENVNRASKTRITAEMLGEVPDFHFEGEDDAAAMQAAVARMTQAGGVAGRAMMQGESIVPALRRAGFTVEDAEAFANLERRAANQYLVSQLSPTMDESAVRAILEVRKVNPARDSAKRSRFWRMVAAGWDADGGAQLVVRDEDDGHGGKRRVIRLFHRSVFRINAPALLIDADACPVVTGAAYPGRAFTRVDVRLQASVTQITDSAVSKHKLLRAEGCEARRRTFGLMVSREVARAGPGKVLAVAPKDVVRALLRDEAPGISADEIEAGAAAGTLQYRGAWISSFGPRTRGVDRWKDCETVVILGSRTPPVGAVEDDARALFGDDPEPLNLIGGEGMFPARQEGIATRDGARVSVEVRHHPDARVDALLRQFREQSSIQAIARIRAVHCERAKRVVILSNIPLEGVEVEELTTWADFAPDRMEAAVIERMHTCAARGVPFGLRFGGASMAADVPGAFPSEKAVERWRSRSGVNPPVSIIESITGTGGLIATGAGGLIRFCEVEVRLEGQRGPKPTPAVIACEPADAKATAAAIWGPVASCKVIRVHGGKPALSSEATDAAADLALKAGAANLVPLASAIAADGAAILASGGDACAVVREAAKVSGSDFGAACTALNLSCEIEVAA